MEISRLLQASGIVLCFVLAFVACDNDILELDTVQPPSALEKQFTAADSSMLNNQEEANKPIAGQYIVVFRDESLPKAFNPGNPYAQNQSLVRGKAAEVLSALGVGAEKIGFTFSASIKGALIKGLSVAQAKQLANNPSVKYIEQDRTVSLQMGGPPWAGDDEEPPPCANNEIEVEPSGIALANGGATYGGDNVAWIMDTGIDTDHPDLNVDAARGHVVAGLKGKGSGTFEDGNGHGTHVAGTVAAKAGNGIGVIGVAAGATVIPVKVLNDRGSGSISGIIAGVDYVAANGAPGDAANLSLGVKTDDQSLNEAVEAAALMGIGFAISAGNDSDYAENYTPASADPLSELTATIATIAAVRDNQALTSFSNYGSPPVDFAAKGSGNCSTYIGGGYEEFKGTSMAAPHAAGVFLFTGSFAPEYLGSCGTSGPDPDGVTYPIICLPKQQ